MATKQKHYTLYIDESETKNSSCGKPHFCMAGAIINDKDYNIVENSVISIKQDIWNDISNPEDIILHQKSILDASKGKLDIRKYPEYERFKSKAVRRKFYAKFSNIFDCGKSRLSVEV